MQADISLIIKLQNTLFADPRRIELLKQIQATGSISQGAKMAGISYKSAWDAINDMNRLADRTLVERATGGKGGGGAYLTPYAERLIQLFQLLQQVQQKAFDVLQDDALPLDSLLAAIARFSLQTSARNQLFATVLHRDHARVQQQMAVKLADGETIIHVALTHKSAERLQLDEGKEVLLLIKAPWIQISRQPQTADNQLTGVIAHIEPGAQQSEVLMTLSSGETLCATVPNTVITQQKLQSGDTVTAYFNADHVIIATLL